MKPLDAPLPPTQPGLAAAGRLTAHPWRLAEQPPAPQAVLPAGCAGAAPQPPALLLIDRREALRPERRERLACLLNAEERQRHDAYRLADDRQRFLLGRGGLRLLLGAWLGLAPQAVPIETGPHGKPHCPIGPCFNVSHSGDLILLALHPLQAVGVDVERLRPELDWLPIARRMLSESECQQLEALPETERPAAFLAAWCRLEARLKARGDGLGGLERLREQELRAERSVPGETAGAALSPSPGPDREGWTANVERLWDVTVPAGYRAAVALAGSAAT
jgi:4'-phosphopantetheinyl transferase